MRTTRARCAALTVGVLLLFSAVLAYGGIYESTNRSIIVAHQGIMSSAPISGATYEYLYVGEVVIYRTNQGRFGKFRVDEWMPISGSIDETLVISWTTYNADGSVYSSGDYWSYTALDINVSCDLDTGLALWDSGDSRNDFVWDNLILTPDNGAVFTVYRGNAPPTADAGADQTVTDTDRNGSQSVSLNGLGSTDSDGTITSYVWREGATQIATGSSPTVSLGLGIHTITLTVTDNAGATGEDTVSITVDSPPLAVGLLCDGKQDPDNVSDYTPIFSWTFADPDVGDSQSACQIRIGSSPGSADVWDWGIVGWSSESLTYAGPGLTPNVSYYWSVQVWDQAGHPSGFSADGTFIILDIGLRVYDGTGIIRIAVDYASDEYPLRIHRNGQTYGIILVDPDDPDACGVRIRTSAGVKAMKRM